MIKKEKKKKKKPARKETDLHDCFAAAFEVLSSGVGFGWHLG